MATRYFCDDCGKPAHHTHTVIAARTVWLDIRPHSNLGPEDPGVDLCTECLARWLEAAAHSLREGDGEEAVPDPVAEADAEREAAAVAF